MLTPDEIMDIRLDIGDGKGALDDVQIQRAWERCSGAKDVRTRNGATRAMLLKWLIADAAKLVDYTEGGRGGSAAMSEKLSQVTAQLNGLLAGYIDDYNSVFAAEKTGIAIVSLHPAKRKGRRWPEGF